MKQVFWVLPKSLSLSLEPASSSAFLLKVFNLILYI